MRKGLKMRKLRTKIMLWYLMFAFLPMVLIMTYVYFYSSQLITAGLNRNLDHEVERMGKELDEKTGDYYMISDMLYTDETLWNYLTADYSGMGFEDLYLYVDSLFTNIRMLYPDIESLSIYSTNHTLPRDEHYFYVVEETSINKKFPQIGGIMYMEKGSEGDLSFSRFMNRYETGIFRNFLTMRVREEEIRSILETGETGFCVMLADETGTVQLSSQRELQGKQIGELDLEKQVVRRRTTEHCGELIVYVKPQLFRQPVRREAVKILCVFALCELDLEKQVVRRRTTEHCGELIVYVKPQLFRQPVRREAVKILCVFALCAGMAFAAIAHWSKGFQKDVEKVMIGAGIISYGDFGHRISYSQNNEIGMIAESVNKLAERIQETIAESYEKELKRKVSEMNQLQEQINPHFLYNALSSISSMAIGNGDRETAQAIVYLADFYRISLNKGNQELTIREEFKLLDSYMRIQQIRFGDGIVLEYNADESLLEHKIMKLTLQPIVENAIHHGRTDDSEFLHILIRLYGEDGKTVLEVIDDGRGISPEKMIELQESMDHSEGGYGLRNVNIRLKLQYGDAYGINLESEPGFGTKVRVELPE